MNDLLACRGSLADAVGATRLTVLVLLLSELAVLLVSVLLL